MIGLLLLGILFGMLRKIDAANKQRDAYAVPAVESRQSVVARPAVNHVAGGMEY